MAFLDTADIYLERFTGDADRYRHRADADGDNAQWADVERRTERIEVRGQSAVDCDVFVTARGPVVAGDPHSGTALVLRHSADVEVDHSFDCLQPMMRAATVDALFEAVRGWGLVDHNQVAGDTQGHSATTFAPRSPSVPRPMAGCRCPAGWSSMHGKDSSRGSRCLARSTRLPA